MLIVKRYVGNSKPQSDDAYQGRELPPLPGGGLIILALRPTSHRFAVGKFNQAHTLYITIGLTHSVNREAVICW